MMKRALVLGLAIFATTACDQVDPDASMVDLDLDLDLDSTEHPTLDDIVDPEGPVEYPVDTIELSNGNVLEFYADDAGWAGVAESVMPDNPSVLDAFSDDTSVLEIYLLATEVSRAVPEALLRTDEGTGLDVNTVLAQTERGAIEQLEVLVNPQSAASWCNLPTFTANYCTDGGLFDDHACAAFWFLQPGGIGQLSTPPALAYRAAYCHQAATSSTFLQYRDTTHGSALPEYACQPLSIGWNTLWSGITDVSKNYHWGGGSYPREFRLTRYAFVASQAHYGHKWATEDCP